MIVQNYSKMILVLRLFTPADGARVECSIKSYYQRIADNFSVKIIMYSITPAQFIPTLNPAKTNSFT